MYLFRFDDTHVYWFFDGKMASEGSSASIENTITKLAKVWDANKSWKINNNKLYHRGIEEPCTLICTIPDDIKYEDYWEYLNTNHPEIFI